MAIEVYRVADDGLSRERWSFDARAEFGGQLSIRLTGYGIERRKHPKGRFAKSTPADRWDSMDERRYYSGLGRPNEIPGEVRCDALAAIKPQFYIGWFNDASRYERKSA